MTAIFKSRRKKYGVDETLGIGVGSFAPGDWSDNGTGYGTADGRPERPSIVELGR
jgi:hypothetical protein